MRDRVIWFGSIHSGRRSRWEVCTAPVLRSFDVPKTNSRSDVSTGATMSALHQSASYQHPQNVDKLSKGILEFMLNLYKEVASNPTANLFLCPFAISAALAMTYAAARESTANEMKKTMRLPHDPSELHLAFEDMLGAHMGIEKPGMTFRVANRMYVHFYTHILPDFLGVVNNQYRTSVAVVNFATDSDNVRQQINKWVEAQTSDKVKDLVEEGDISALSRLILVNAAYFKGDWANQFNRMLTKSGEFFVDSTKKVTVEMMEMKARLFSGGSIDLDARVLELPYIGKEISMLVVLPNDLDGLREVEMALSPKTWSEIVNGTFEADTKVMMPKFRLEYSMSLTDTLAKMGMATLFDPQTCNLSGLTGAGNIHVSSVLHKVVFEVDEVGGEPTSESTEVLNSRSMPLADPEFIVDHPFLVFVLDTVANVILFMGRVRNPVSRTLVSFAPAEKGEFEFHV